MRTDSVVAQVGFEAQKDVRLDGVFSCVLQSIRPHFICKTNAAPFLAHVKQNALARRVDFFQRRSKLVATIATQRAKRVARQAFGVDAHQNIFFTCHVAFNQREMTFAVERALVSLQSEVPVLAGEVDIGDLFNEFFSALAILNQRADGYDIQPMLSRELF